MSLSEAFHLLRRPLCNVLTVAHSQCVFLLQQTKRKLDDANKRLEFLYDKLREQTVSVGFMLCLSETAS